jgi:GntR family transcriptional repressor for pyruvate dehydrogenase complex
MPDALGKVKRRALHEDVMVQLAAYLRQGKLKPGDRLPPERELAERMQVSRTTLREALRLMQLQSLIVSRHGSGTYLAEGKAARLAQAVTEVALHDIFEARRLLDPWMAALAARRATPKDIVRLKSILQEQEEQMRRAVDGADSDTRFHSAIAEATHNRALIQLAQVLTEIFAPSRGSILQSDERAKKSVLFHKRILKAIEAHSPEEARRAMAEHVRSVDRELLGKDGAELKETRGAP